MYADISGNGVISVLDVVIANQALINCGGSDESLDQVEIAFCSSASPHNMRLYEAGGIVHSGTFGFNMEFDRANDYDALFGYVLGTITCP